MTESAFSSLAHYCGIDPDYLNYRGEHTAVSHASRARVLQLLTGHDGGEQADAELRRRQETEWARPLPHTLLRRSGSPVQLEINFPREELDRQWTLALSLEDGLQQRFPLIPGSCAEFATEAFGSVSYSRRTITLDTPIPEGYHQLTVLDEQGKNRSNCQLCIAPDFAFQPEKLSRGEKIFGISVQLYTVRSQRNWGMGDFTDLVNIMRDAAGQGVEVVGVNPLHALFPANPLHFSPYSPSNRAFLNVMYLDVEALAQTENCRTSLTHIANPDFQSRLAVLREKRAVDYQGVAEAKLPLLEKIYRQFCEAQLNHDSARAAQFRQFISDQGDALQQHCTYDALHEHFLRQDMALWGWPVWPKAYRQPDSEAVRRFRDEHHDRIQYFQYLQWCASEQLLQAQLQAQGAGMAVGMYLDLAVGADLSGSEVWSNQCSFSLEASAGAPPDALATSGQDWGFPPLRLHGDRRNSYQLFVRNLRANMALCGAVRYDHAVSLLRLWWIPRGDSASDGAYVNYPLQDLLGLLALESQRNQCLVIGEDLGTVPEILRRVMKDNHLYSYRVLYFEKTHGKMTRPENYPREAVATISTHDLPTLASWWDGSDLNLREDLALLGDTHTVNAMHRDRGLDKQQLLDALITADCWNQPAAISELPAMTEALNCAIHRYLASSTSAVMICQIEDMMQMLTPVNVPGTFREHANWQRKLRYPMEGFFDRKEVRAMCATMREARA